MIRATLAGAAGMLWATAAVAQEVEPRFCPNRPSLGEATCTTDPGHVLLEMSAIDWELDHSDDGRQDTILAGDFQLRIGVTPTAELQVNWTPYGHVRTRDATGISSVARVGDVQVGWRQSVRNPDGKGLSIAIQPSITLPVGRQPVGAGTWSAGLVVPVSYDLSDALNLSLTNEAAAEANDDGDGRHLMVSETAGLGYQFGEMLTAVGEIQYVRSEQPDDRHDEVTAAGSLAWQPRHGLQFDVIVARGLNADAPAWRVGAGGAILF